MILSTDLVVGPNTAYAKEITKWEAHHTQYGPPQRPHQHRDYPARMYKPYRPSQGGVAFEAMDANNENERERLERVGFVYGGQDKALEKLVAQEFELAELAAERNRIVRGMSGKAQAEVEAVEASAGIKHLGDLGEAHPKTGRREAR